MTRHFTLSALALLLFAAGCGGGDDEEATTPEDPSAAFREEASAICLDAGRETVGVQLGLGQVDVTPDQSPEQALQQATGFEELTINANEEFAALEPPAELADTYAEFLEARNELAPGYVDRIAALEAGDLPAADAALTRIGEIETRAIDLAEEMALDGCDAPLPPEQEAEVEETVKEIASSLDGERVCNELVYPEFVDYVFEEASGPYSGGLEGCISFQEDPANVSDVSFEKITGVDGAYAFVNYRKIGGSDDGLRILEKLFFDEELGHWRLWSSDPAEEAQGTSRP